MEFSDIIAIDPGKRAGNPRIRGLRVTVYDVAADRERKLEILSA